MTAVAGSLPMSPDRVYEVLEARLLPDLRFRASLITSLALHTGLLIVALMAPLLIPRQPLLPPTTPVRLVSFASIATPTPEEEAEPAAEEPEPVPPAVAVTEPEPVPRTLEALRREREAEEERKREEEEEARRRAEAERRRREEEERRKPQRAERRSTETQPQLIQEAQRGGTIGVLGGERPTGLTEEEFRFSYYLNILLTRIGARWTPPPRGPYAKPLTAIMYFRIDRNGNLVVGPDIQSTSSERLFDQAAQRAIASAAPFPPLPLQYQGSSLGVHLAFKQQ